MSSTRTGSGGEAAAAPVPRGAGDRAFEPGLHVVATAGHIDHGKSSLITALTGTDPDRLAEEKRRGLTIDLGFAWTELPSGREVGFVDVPGHERFVRTMLAGVGPVRLVLFVVAADEGWKPQSEEHVAIVDVLGARGVVALAKADLVDADTLEAAERDIRSRLGGTGLADAAIVPVSSATGLGLDELRDALDALIAGSPVEPDRDRPRLFVDRVFSIKGAGTVVTGTLAGGSLSVGEEIELSPAGGTARVRGLQTHMRSITTAVPVSRVAVNLAGLERDRVRRGDALGHPGQWRSTDHIEGRVRLVRGVEHALTARGAYKLYAGSAEVDATLRLYGASSLGQNQDAFARVTLARPLPLDLFEPFVLRESGRRETVAGGVVIDLDPPARPGVDPIARLRRRLQVPSAELPRVLAEERGAVRASDVLSLTGVAPSEAAIGGWIVSDALRERARDDLVSFLEAFHAQNPMLEGEPLGAARTRVAEQLRRRRAPEDPGLVEALIEALVADGTLRTSASTIRLASHRVALEDRDEELGRLLDTLAAGEPMPPSQTDLVSSGFDPDVIDAAVRADRLVRVSPELVVRPAFVASAERALRDISASGGELTVSAFRERLETSRRYAVPLLEHFDRTGVTIRRGDLRVLRGS